LECSWWNDVDVDVDFDVDDSWGDRHDEVPSSEPRSIPALHDSSTVEVSPSSLEANDETWNSDDRIRVRVMRGICRKGKVYVRRECTMVGP